jgi:hypothetical protein
VAIQEKKEGKSSQTGNMTNKTNQKHNTICVGDKHAQTYTNNLNNAPSHTYASSERRQPLVNTAPLKERNNIQYSIRLS